MKLTQNQEEAFGYWNDDNVNTVVFSSGMAGGATTLCLCCLITSALNADNGRFYYASKQFESFYNYIYSFTEKNNINIVHNLAQAKFTFENGSEICLINTEKSDTDLEYDRFNSIRYDGLAYDLVHSEEDSLALIALIKRKKIDGKILIITRPNIDFIRERYYNIFTGNNLLDSEKMVIQTIDDNPHISKTYLDNIKHLINKQNSGIWD